MTEDNDQTSVSPAAEPTGPATTPRKGGKRGNVSQAQRRASNIPVSQTALDRTRENAALTTALVPTESIMLDPQGRAIDPAGVEKIKATAVHKGITTDLKLRPVREGETSDPGIKYVVFRGGHRLVAARELGLPVVPAKVAEAWDEKEGAEEAFIDNDARTQQSPFEDARSLKRIRDAAPGMTLETLASRVGWTEAKVQQRLKYLDVPEALARVLGDGQHEAGYIDIARAVLADELPTEWVDKIALIMLDVAQERDSEDNFVSARQFATAVERELKERLGALDVNAYEFQKYSRRAAWKAALEEAITVTVPPSHRGGPPTLLALEREPFEAAAEKIEAALKEEAEKDKARAKGQGDGADAAKAREERRARLHDQQVERRARQIQREGIKKALAGIGDAEPRVLDLLIRVLEKHVEMNNDALDHLADVCGLDVESVRAATSSSSYLADTKRMQTFPGLLKKLKKRDPAAYWRFIAGAAAYYLHEGDSRWHGEAEDESIYRLLTGSTWERAKKAAEKEIQSFEKLKAEGKVPRVKPAEDARSVKCPTCAGFRGKGGEVGKWCVTPTGHTTRVFHPSRIKLWGGQQTETAAPEAAEA